ncbi:MAG: response regulator, partial [Candidatus Eremiobacteraeota bacterium]|nr:response regulator [Candidatus Eremiobacteraeota bacterium]
MTLRNLPTLLVVDDAPANLAVVYSLLKSDFRILVAPSGAKALELVKSANPPQLILLDVAMPEMDGYAICRALKADPVTRSIPVIFLTGKTDPEDEALGFECGCADIVHKPFHPTVLKARIRNCLRLS